MCSACFLFSSFVCLAYQNKSLENAIGLKALWMGYNPEKNFPLFMKPELTQGQRLRLEEGGWKEIIPKYTLAYIDAMKKCSKSNFRSEMYLIRCMLDFGKCHEFEKKALWHLTGFVSFPGCRNTTDYPKELCFQCKFFLPFSFKLHVIFVSTLDPTHSSLIQIACGPSVLFNLSSVI